MLNHRTTPLTIQRFEDQGFDDPRFTMSDQELVIHSWRRHESFARPNVIDPVLDVNADRVPLAVLRSVRGVAQVVLAAELVGDSGCRRIQIARAPDDLGSS